MLHCLWPFAWLYFCFFFLSVFQCCCFFHHLLHICIISWCFFFLSCYSLHIFFGIADFVFVSMRFAPVVNAVIMRNISIELPILFLNEQFKDIFQIWKDVSINVQLNKWLVACNLMHVLAQNVFDIIWSILFRTARSKIEFESTRVFSCQQLYVDKRNHLFYFLARIFRTFSFLTV